MSADTIVLTLTKEEAMVLFEFVSRFTNSDELSIEDQAEERILWDVCALLEKVLAEPFDPNWNEILQKARNAIRDDESEG